MTPVEFITCMEYQVLLLESSVPSLLGQRMKSTHLSSLLCILDELVDQLQNRLESRLELC